MNFEIYFFMSLQFVPLFCLYSYTSQAIIALLFITSRDIVGIGQIGPTRFSHILRQHTSLDSGLKVFQAAVRSAGSETTGRSRLGLTLNIPYVFNIINGLQVISLVIVWGRVMKVGEGCGGAAG